MGETPSRICGAGFPHVWACIVLLVAPLVFRAVGPCCGAGLLGVPAGGGPPVSRPRREPPARRVDSLSGQAPPPPTGTAARPGPAAAHGHRSPALRPPGASTPAARLVLLCVGPSCLLLSNFARNSPVTISEFELASLELQRFWAVFKSDRGKLRADLVLPRLCRRPRAPLPGPPVPPAAYTPVARGVLCVARRIGATSG